MQTMNISLPEPMKRFVEQQIASGRYGNVSEYVRALIREDERQHAQEKLEALLLQGLEGEAAALTDDDWRSIRETAVAQLKARAVRRA
ncbi:type II toxin-antitoxin system ParD family antitoxin [Methyloversatilis sp. XJ19-13]|uniref:type II toxin-antitoxin system ParD family antitoxin n=1 Tax=Methyloversatilis sp. XJ19-13 TaxID=2963430 RepID=UPI00211C1C42|nr:type II toxin-antitoxin system ParD family antitoxin [Methyloversatilis sp. XJ19-13]MCQ9376055.1 type II toxin-antitoxin system ParD family antitoxin [Methyloversatilis sp. XJ19-13]